MTRRVLVVLGRGVVDVGEPIVSATDQGLLRGESAFETLLVVGSRPAMLDEHLARLVESAAALDIPLPPSDTLAALVAEALAAWPDDVEGRLRIVVTKGCDPAVRTTRDPSGVTFVLIEPTPAANAVQRERGVTVVTLAAGVPSGLRTAAPWLLGGAKTTSYAVPMAALRAAAAAGADDAVWVSSDGEVLEAATATVCWVSGRTIITPPSLEVGTLPGITWGLLARLAREAGLTADERRGRIDELRRASEVALLSSVRGIVPVVSIDGRPVGEGIPGPVVKAMQAAFAAAIKAGRTGN